jgi:hypothetical protein
MLGSLTFWFAFSLHTNVCAWLLVVQPRIYLSEFGLGPFYLLHLDTPLRFRTDDYIFSKAN